MFRVNGGALRAPACPSGSGWRDAETGRSRVAPRGNRRARRRRDPARRRGGRDGPPRVAAGGFSIGVITHYFRDKDELIACAFDWLAGESFAALEATLADAQPGLARMRAALEFMVPLPGARSFPARLAQPLEWRDAQSRRWRRCTAGITSGGAESSGARWPRPTQRHEISPHANPADAVDLLAAGIDGLWIAITFEGRRFNGTRRKRLVAMLLAAVLGPARGRR